jgi:ribose/xylose/arabinose/galactoside ABC-type transport system permease subunit
MKLIQGIIVGALCSGFLSAISAYYVAVTSDTISDFGLKAKDFWWLAMILGGAVGLIAGGIIGLIVSTLNLNPIKSGLLGFLFSAIPACFFLLSSVNKFDDNFTRFGTFLLAITTITGIAIPLINKLFVKTEF